MHRLHHPSAPAPDTERPRRHSLMTTPAAATTRAAAAPAQLSLDDDGSALTFTANGKAIATYTYKPTDSQYESPRPFFHPLTTLGGDEVTISRPWDHVWHKGLSWALPNVGRHNFWGGATYTRATEYANLDNNGAMTHGSFTRIDQSGAGITVSESLTWTSQEREPVIAESRRFCIKLLGSDDRGGAYAILFETRMGNISGEEILI